MKKIIAILFILSHFCFGQTFSETKRFGCLGSEPGQFNRPMALDISKGGALYVVDTGNNRIQLFDLSGQFIKSIGGFGFENDQFDQPKDIWTRSLVNIYVSDYNNQRLQRYDRNMNFISSLLTDDSNDPDFQFNEAASCAINSQNDLFLLDCGENKIIKFNRNDNPERYFGSYESGEGELEQPVQLDILPGSRLIVSDISRRSIMVYDFFGNYLIEISTPSFKTPRGIAVSDDGRIFVADADAAKIFIISADFKNVSELKLNLIKPLKQPMDLAIHCKIRKEKKHSLLYIIDDNEIIIGKLIEPEGEELK